MPNKFLKRKIASYEFRKNCAMFFIVIFAFLVGKYLNQSYIMSLILGMTTGIILIFLEYCIKNQSNYYKGLKLESQIEEKLKRLNLNYEQHIETDYGDLDFLVTKDNNSYYGLEVKNWSGSVTFENNLLRVCNFNHTDVLTTLLKNCKFVRDAKFGENSDKFIIPILIFGYKSIVNISQNRIIFHDTEIIIATIQDFESYLK